MSDDHFRFAIDRGGTFTDVYAKCPGGKIRVMKLLSVDPANYDDAPREGIRRILEQVIKIANFYLELMHLTNSYYVETRIYFNFTRPQNRSKL